MSMKTSLYSNLLFSFDEGVTDLPSQLTSRSRNINFSVPPNYITRIPLKNADQSSKLLCLPICPCHMPIYILDISRAVDHRLEAAGGHECSEIPFTSYSAVVWIQFSAFFSAVVHRRSSLIQFLAFFSAVGRSGSHRSGSHITSPPPSFGSQTSSPPSFGYLKLLLSSMWFIIELASSGRSAQSKFILPLADLIRFFIFF
ncbi:hypothetical protein Q3G72_000749 [Acer saccharum]|nr:hypothetical protein Q3G72_000749 [Acer saccharum]